MSNLDSRSAVQRRRELSRIRIEALLALREGLITLEDFFDTATTSDGRALASLTIRQLLTWLPDYKPSDVELVYTGMLAGLSMRPAEVSSKSITVRWLLDRRTGGRRWESLWLAVRTFESARSSDDGAAKPWPGFPFAPAPKEAA